MSYIAKKYNSGVTEIDIYIPTTKTYYLCHTQGSANCSGSMFDRVYRKNLDQINGIQTTVDASLENNTKLTLAVSNVLFGIDDVLDVTITGNSLPLKIYKDDTYEDEEGTAAQLFHSTIQPSIVLGYDRDLGCENGMCKFNFSCYGQDAQAIRLMFYDSKNVSTWDTFRIKFNPNGGSGTMPYQRMVVGQDVSLKKNEYYRNQCVFVGWSIGRPKTDNSIADLQDREVFGSVRSEEFDKHIESGDILNLYAVWMKYTASGSETTFTFESDGSDLAIDGMAVYTETDLKDKVILDY